LFYLCFDVLMQKLKANQILDVFSLPKDHPPCGFDGELCLNGNIVFMSICQYVFVLHLKKVYAMHYRYTIIRYSLFSNLSLSFHNMF